MGFRLTGHNSSDIEYKIASFGTSIAEVSNNYTGTDISVDFELYGSISTTFPDSTDSSTAIADPLVSYTGIIM